MLLHQLKIVVNIVSQDNLTELLKEIQEDLSVDEFLSVDERFISWWTLELRNSIKKYNFLDTNNQLLLAIKKMQGNYVKNCDAVEYYSVFYSDIVISCSSYFKGLKP